jgi:catalase
MQVASNVLSRVTYYRHEGQPSEYDQVRELYRRVFNPEQRANLHKNTAILLQVRQSFALVHEFYSLMKAFRRMLACGTHRTAELSYPALCDRRRLRTFDL